MQAAFEELKNAPCLAFSDPNGEFEVTTDASEDVKAIGAVLTQNDHSMPYESVRRGGQGQG